MWNERHLPAVSGRQVDETGKEYVEIGSHRRGILEELEKAHIYIERLSERLKEKEAEAAEFRQQLENRDAQMTLIAARLAHLETLLVAGQRNGD